MKKENLYKFFLAAGILMFMGFAIRIGADYLKYDVSSSAPFYVNILVRSLEFNLPAILFLIIGIALKRKYK